MSCSGQGDLMELTEHQKHYLAMLGVCCDDARLAGMTVSLELDDGRLVEGVPRSSPTGPNDQEIDHTGVNPYLEIDGELVMLEHVRGYRVARP